MQNKTLLSLLLSAGLMSSADAQRVVYDKRHFQAVNENAVARQAAELTHNNYLEKIDQNLNNINTNVSSVVLAQTIIYEGLSNVNSALKNGLAVRNMSVIIADLIGYSSQIAVMARAEPYLLLFAEDFASQMKARSLRLAADVSGFVLKEGSNVLSDYNGRDQLIRQVTQELQIISSLVYGAWKAMFWAKERGIFRSINPFQSFIDQDRQHVEDILREARYLKK
jgi:hypothetical protein